MTQHLSTGDAGPFEDTNNETETTRRDPGPQRRKRSLGRYWSRADKWRIVEESHQRGTSVSLVARCYDVNVNPVFNLRRDTREGLDRQTTGGYRIIKCRDGVFAPTIV